MIQRRATRRSGMTLVEVAMGAAFLAFIGYILTTTVQISTQTQATVMESVTGLGRLRSGAKSLRSALRQASEDLMTVTTLPSGDSELTVQEPITVAGNPAWGVWEEELGPDDDSRTQEDWFLRFTVRQVPLDGGGMRHDLVRQVIDTAAQIRLESTLVTDLFQGDALDPGFQVRNVGDVWEVSIRTAGVVDNTKGHGVTLHARTRN